MLEVDVAIATRLPGNCDGSWHHLYNNPVAMLRDDVAIAMAMPEAGITIAMEEK